MTKTAIGEVGALGLRKGLTLMCPSLDQKKTGVGRQSNILSSNLADVGRECGRPSYDDSDGTTPGKGVGVHLSLTPVKFDDKDSVKSDREPIPKRTNRKLRTENGNSFFSKKNSNKLSYVVGS